MPEYSGSRAADASPNPSTQVDGEGEATPFSSKERFQTQQQEITYMGFWSDLAGDFVNQAAFSALVQQGRDRTKHLVNYREERAQATLDEVIRTSMKNGTEP